MNQFDQEKIEFIINLPDCANDHEIPKELYDIIYSLGRDAENPEEYQYAFQHLLVFSQHENVEIRAQVILAFSLLAVFHGHLDRALVEPLIFQEWQRATPENRMTIQDAVDDLNIALDWDLNYLLDSVATMKHWI